MLALPLVVYLDLGYLPDTRGYLELDSPESKFPFPFLDLTLRKSYKGTLMHLNR